MFRGTTARLIVKLTTQLDLTTISEIWLTIKQGQKSKTWEMNELSVNTTEKTITLEMTQSESLNFEDGDAELQLRFLTADEKALASSIATVNINKILKGGIIE